MTVQGELIRIGRHEERITHPDKLLFPDDGVTKQDLIDDYRSIASWILPTLRGRPLVLESYPAGINVFFFHAEDATPDPLVTGVQTCALPISARSLPTGQVTRA